MALHQHRPQDLLTLKVIAQVKWERLHADEYEDVRAEFIRQVGKSYV